jgi:hypothetical protein
MIRTEAHACAVFACFAFFVAAILTPESALAFAPGGFQFFPGSKTHVEITEEAMQVIYIEIGAANITQSMKLARKQITDANREVDQDQFSSAKHADGENFAGAQLRTNDLLSQVVIKIKANDVAGGRSSLGSALHTVQDFYAHSNWVELGNGAPSSELGRPGASAACPRQERRPASTPPWTTHVSSGI